MPLGDPMVENRGIRSRDTIQLPILGLGKHIFDNVLQILFSFLVLHPCQRLENIWVVQYIRIISMPLEEEMTQLN